MVAGLVGIEHWRRLDPFVSRICVTFVSRGELRNHSLLAAYDVRLWCLEDLLKSSLHLRPNASLTALPASRLSLPLNGFEYRSLLYNPTIRH